MKKTICILICISVIFVQEMFADNEAGTNKIGVYAGYPFGISFSHNFTKKDQLDIQAAPNMRFIIKNNDSYFHFGGDFYIGYLRSVAEPIIRGAVCPFEIGAGIGLFPGVEQTYPDKSKNFAFYVGTFFDLRWEVFFTNVPKFSLFLDFAPGVYFNPTAFRYNRHLAVFAARGGIGLRYVF
ncbi:hypothetical protein [Treponema pedis]|uniref:hypothetical protein n=1 Tax=Treponema pedis TaxID=409322 RepID=UPI0003FA5ECB|nr:hypothetical protein [Treponema pedis]QSI05849.1 hypothetical protein DYQ05_13515 [Treponema pedis]